MKKLSAWTAFVVGIALTAVSAGAAYLADKFHAPTLGSYLYWPNSLLQAFSPCVPLSSTDVPGSCEGSPINLLMFFLSFPASIVICALAAFLLTRAFGHSNHHF